MTVNGRRSSSSDRESSLNRNHLSQPRLVNLDEESALESPHAKSTNSYPVLPQPRIALDSDTEAEESDGLLSSSHSSFTTQRERQRRGRPKRKHTLSMSTNSIKGYGSLGQSQNTIIAETEGRPLQRQESVLKVSYYPPSCLTRRDFDA
jgi:hypothetical protein